MPGQNKIAIVAFEPRLNPYGNKGAYFPEVYRSWKAYSDGGFHVQLISESGTISWDSSSIQANGPGCPTPEELAILEEPEHPFNSFVSQIKSVKDVSAKDYAALFTAGGEATCLGCEDVSPLLYQFFQDMRDQGCLVSFSFQDLP